MHTFRRLSRCALLLALLVLLAAACRSADGDAITIGVHSASDHAPFFIADRHGLYAEDGLDVTVRVIATNTEVLEALHRGDLQMGAIPVTAAIAAIAQGKPLRIVAMTGRGSDGLLVRADGPPSIAELRGKRIATIRASILDVLLRHTLQEAGLDPDRDVELVYLSQLGDLVAALKTSQVDACSNTEPFMTDAEHQGWGRILTYYTAVWPDHPCCVVVARDDMLRRRPEVVGGVLDAHCRAVDWAEGHPPETAALIVDALGGFDVDVVEASLDASKMRMDCQRDPAEAVRMADLMAAQGLIDVAPQPLPLAHGGGQCSVRPAHGRRRARGATPPGARVPGARRPGGLCRGLSPRTLRRDAAARRPGAPPPGPAAGRAPGLPRRVAKGAPPARVGGLARGAHDPPGNPQHPRGAHAGRPRRDPVATAWHGAPRGPSAGAAPRSPSPPLTRLEVEIEGLLAGA